LEEEATSLAPYLETHHAEEPVEEVPPEHPAMLELHPDERASIADAWRGSVASPLGDALPPPAYRAPATARRIVVIGDL
jgi:hypothetical protein